jgi:hypothetical protein
MEYCAKLTELLHSIHSRILIMRTQPCHFEHFFLKRRYYFICPTDYSLCIDNRYSELNNDYPCALSLYSDS